MGFSDYETAMKARDVHARLVETVVNRLRPEVRQGEVYDFNTADMTCQVLLPGDAFPLKVKMGRGQVPLHRKMDADDGSAQGDIVRFAGKAGNYYLVSVYGEEPPEISGLTGPMQNWTVSAPSNTDLTDTSVVDVTGVTINVPVASASDVFLVVGTAYLMHNAADNSLAQVRLTVGGTDRNGLIFARAPADAAARGTFHQNWIVTGVAPGTVTFKFRATLNVAGSWTVVSTHTRMTIVKLEGAQGPQGIQGGVGPANSLAIGSVTNVGPGAAATASITGTPPAQTLSLGIPQGIPGPSGPPGVGSSSAVKDEGVSKVAVPTSINFIGAGVVATQNGSDAGQADVTINGVPVAHTHTEADVTNLVTDLAGKAPTVHTHTKSQITDLGTIGTAAAKDVPSSGDATTAQVVMGNDSRLTNARTPSAHQHPASDINSGTLVVDRLGLTPAATTYLKGAATAGTATWVVTSTLKTDLALVKGDVGLGNVDNTSDANKPLSTAETNALSNKAPLTHTHGVTDLTATGTKDTTTYLRGDNSWGVPPGTGSVTLGTVVTETGYGQASANGVATSVSRSDHTHGTPALGASATQAAPGNHTHSAAAPAAHATTHQPGGSDAMAVDAAVGTGSLRTIGTGALQAAAGSTVATKGTRYTTTVNGSSMTPGTWFSTGLSPSNTFAVAPAVSIVNAATLEPWELDWRINSTSENLEIRADAVMTGISLTVSAYGF